MSEVVVERQILQIAREFPIYGGKVVKEGTDKPDAIISIVAHNYGRTGDLSVAFARQYRDGVRQDSESITFFDAGFMSGADWEGLLVGLLSTISQRRLNDRFKLAELTLNVIPATLFLTGWKTLEITRKKGKGR